MVADKAAVILVAIQADDERGIRGGGQTVIKELESTYLRVTSETTCTLRMHNQPQPWNLARALILPPSSVTTAARQVSTRAAVPCPARFTGKAICPLGTNKHKKKTGSGGGARQ